MGKQVNPEIAENKLDPLNDWKGFYQQLQNESPRGAVIIAGAFLDAQLRDLLSKFLIDDPKSVGELLGTIDGSEGPLSSFGSRISAAYRLGLISKSQHDDLRTIKKIRNKLAHRMHDYTFDEKQIVSWCKSLKLAKMITDAIPHFPNTHADMFLVGVVQLASWLGVRTLEVERNRRFVPNDPKISQVVTASTRRLKSDIGIRPPRGGPCRST